MRYTSLPQLGFSGTVLYVEPFLRRVVLGHQALVDLVKKGALVLVPWDKVWNICWLPGVEIWLVVTMTSP